MNKEELKIVDVSPAWTCENLDNLAPIDWQGYAIRLSDNTVRYVDDLPVPDMELATKEEKKSFFRKYYHFLYPGDEVEIYKGRKLPIGSRKIIQSIVTRCIEGTYGHGTCDWVTFTDGTACNLKNIKLVGSDVLE